MLQVLLALMMSLILADLAGKGERVLVLGLSILVMGSLDGLSKGLATVAKLMIDHGGGVLELCRDPRRS